MRSGLTESAFATIHVAPDHEDEIGGDCPGSFRTREYLFVIMLRLRRMGAKKRPFYRIVAAEHSSPRDGRFIEILGYYNPLTDPVTVNVNEERARHWLSVGAKPSGTVERLLKQAGVTGNGAGETTEAPAAEATA